MTSCAAQGQEERLALGVGRGLDLVRRAEPRPGEGRRRHHGLELHAGDALQDEPVRALFELGERDDARGRPDGLELAGVEDRPRVGPLPGGLLAREDGHEGALPRLLECAFESSGERFGEGERRWGPELEAHDGPGKQDAVRDRKHGQLEVELEGLGDNGFGGHHHHPKHVFCSW
jgi:hypothetical protein